MSVIKEGEMLCEYVHAEVEAPLGRGGGNQECVQLLVAAGANIELEDVKGQTPLFVATSQRKPIIMKVWTYVFSYSSVFNKIILPE
ncbi:hypothetical protein E2C01_098209 [Portunus trituberculatus]|uniref:Uncharacterized protein n=1 Tax=Portunus trituberculatus TaxID=210409 RepID=A0A5B7KDF9_PORTR|nr:hypothetical protein [Portunus trituberculatus]